MIRHTPYGIDDPYKRLRTERFPRDPEQGQPVQVSFACDTHTHEAWLELHGAQGSRRFEAQALGGGVWSAQLPPLQAGSYRYTLHARRTPEGPADATAPFDLPVAAWRSAGRVLEVVPHDHGVDLRFARGADPDAKRDTRDAIPGAHDAAPDGRAAASKAPADAPGELQGAEAARDPWLRLSVPAAGVCTVALEVAGRHAAGSAPAGAREVGQRAGGPACRVEVDGGRVRLAAPGLEVHIDTAANTLTLSRPAAPKAVVAMTLAPAWREAPDGSVTGVRTRLQPAEDAAVYGLGERFEGPDLRGRRWDTRVYEEYKEQGARTYLPVPLLVSALGWGVFTDTAAPAAYDLRGPGYDILTAPAASGPEVVHHLIVADEPYGVTAAYTGLTGAIARMPDWAFGPWMSANTWNSQALARAAVDRTVAEDVPATVLVIEAWSDEATFYTFNDAEYQPRSGDAVPRLADFRFAGRWPDPKGFVDACHDRGVRVLLWQIPVQRRLAAPHPQHQADEVYMLEHGFAIREADGSPYRNRGWWFPDALVLDVTNPEACDWWFAKRRYLFRDVGIDGMKTDGGEHLWGRGVRAHDGSRGEELVNAYAQRYVDAYHAFVRDATGGDGLTFSRSGTSGAQRSPAHWAGDENSTWDGFRASILAGLSAGLAGVSLWGWDLGGFSGEIPTVELYLRGAATACFCPIMQYHSELHQAAENRDRTPWNIAERHGDEAALSVYRAFAKLRMRLLPYLAGEARALSEAGVPMMRLPALAYPEDHDRLAGDRYAYLFGRDLLVCPVHEKGAGTRDVVLPPGAWMDLWSGARFDGGGTVIAPAPLDRIPVFVRADSPRLETLRDAVAPFPD